MERDVQIRDVQIIEEKSIYEEENIIHCQCTYADSGVM